MKKDSRFLSSIWAMMFFLLVVVSCTPYSHKARQIAETSFNPELRRFLQYYEGNDKEKFKAACFVVSNMPGKYSIDASTGDKVYDIDIVEADSLIYSLEKSFEIWKDSPYSGQYGFDDFCEYILPYRVANEPLNYYWKEDCRNWLDVPLTEDLRKTANMINNSIRINIIPANTSSPLKSYAEIRETEYGKCEDRAVLLAMALRSAGIPAAYEFVPIWGSNNNGHAFVSVIKPDGSIIPLANSDEQGQQIYLSRKTPKIFRKMYSINSMAKRNEEDTLDTALLFRDGDIIDVTSSHDIGMTDVDIKVKGTQGPIYLSVFSPNGWQPVTYSKNAHFIDVGTGVNSKGLQEDEAEDLGDGILYLPSVISGGSLQPVSDPVIISEKGIYPIEVDTLATEEVTMLRKYPLNTRIVGFAKSMIGGVFEGADNPDFSDAEILYEIASIPESRMQTINIAKDKTYRYIRYKRKTGIFSIAEMKIYDSSGQEVKFRPISCSPLENRPEERGKIFDNDPLTYFEIAGGIDMWVGADLGRPITVSKIGFAPRNDDNAISPGDIYELFYWVGYWKSAGVKQADDYSISFKNIPRHALMWLRDLTRGREERPFTYEDGRQIWW